MPISDEMIAFIGQVTGKAEDAKKYEAQLQDKNQAISEIVEGGLEGNERDSLRTAMNFVMKTKKGKDIQSISPEGQEHEIDSGDTSQLQGLDKNLQPLIQKAMDKIVQMKNDLKSRKGKDGQPLFTDAEIADELFTRLHREGLMPENLIIDEYSVTAKLLGESMKRYKAMLDEIRLEKEKAKAKQRIDVHGAGNKRDMLKAAIGELTDIKDSALDATTGKLFAAIRLGETEEDRKRMLDVTKKGVMAGMKVASVVSAGKYVNEVKTDTVPATPDPKLLATNFVSSTLKTFKNPDQAEAVSKLLAGHISEITTVIKNAIKDNVDEGEAVATFLKEILKTNIGATVKDSVTGTPSVISGAVSNILDGVSLGSVKLAFDDAATKSKLQEASLRLVESIDHALSAAIAKINPLAGPLFIGAYDRVVDAVAIADMATEDEKPDAQGIINALADGYLECMNVCNPDPNKTVFPRVGVEMAKAFKGKANASTLAKAIKEDPKTAFASLQAASSAAVARALGLPGPDGKTEPSDDSTASKNISEALKNPETTEAMRGNLADAKASELSKEWDASAEDQEEYERMLILIDEGGDFMAEQRSIENLIAKLEADRKTLELVASVGSEIAGIGGLLGTVATDGAKIASQAAGEAAKHFTGPIGGAIKAAQLIVQLTVNAIKAAERWELWFKFQNKVQKTKRARSALLPAIQNLYENKQEQITYHTIEDAMLAIQLAGALTECVPHEIAQATGKLITAIGSAGQAANTAAYAGYNEVQLRKAWATTRASINNPASRSVGLAAIHENPTLAMVAIAWASTNGDRMARSILSDTGINEQTLAHHQGDSGTEKKIVQHLETLLSEDRQLKDSEKIKSNWYPTSIELTRESWLTSKNRAMKKASPPLKDANTGAIESALRLVQGQTNIETLRAKLDETPALTLNANLKQVENLIKELGKFTPRTEDMTPHAEMSVLIERYTARARQLRLEIAQLRDEKLEIEKGKLVRSRRVIEV